MKPRFLIFLGTLCCAILLTSWFLLQDKDTSNELAAQQSSLNGNKAGDGQSQAGSAGSTNLARLDWSKSETAKFKAATSTIRPAGGPHSNSVRCLPDKPDFEIGDEVRVTIRIDEPAGFGLKRSEHAELISPENRLQGADKTRTEGPFQFPETPQALYYRLYMKCDVLKAKPGKWRIEFSRAYLNVKHEEKTPEDRIQFEQFESSVTLKHKSKKS